MSEDEWGMIVNAAGPAVLDAPPAVCGTPDFWRDRLSPDERLLWTGRPGGGLGLFGMDLPEVLRMLSLLAVAGAVVWMARNNPDPNLRPVWFLLFWGAVLKALATLAIRARRLVNSRYAATDRRSIVVSGVIRPDDGFDLPHDASAPRRMPGRWGETIFDGRRMDGVPSGWQKWVGWTGDSGPWCDNLIFHRLDAAESPLRLLQSLRRDGGVPVLLRALPLTGMPT